MRPVSTRLHNFAVLGVLALVPLLLLPDAFFYFDVTPKVLMLLVGTAAALLVWGAETALRDSRERRWLGILLMAQAASLVTSTLFSTDRALSLTGTNWRRFGLGVQLALLLYTWLLARQSVQYVLRVIAASGGAGAIYGIAQYFGWDPWLPKQAYHVGEGVWTIVRPPGTLGHADYFGVYLLSVACAGAALARAEQQRLWKWLGAGAAALAAVAIVLSGTRSALVGLAAGAVALAIWLRPRFTLRGAALAAAVAAGLVAFYLSPAGLLLRARARWFREDPLGGGRLTVWADTLRMGGHRWLAGFGPETYTSQFPRFQSKALARAFPNQYYESPHNIFLDALAGLGVAGPLLLFVFAAFGLWAARRAARAGSPYAAPLGAGLIAAVVANEFVAFTLPTALLFYATVAALCGCVPATRPASASAPPLALRLAGALALAAAALSLGAGDFWVARTRDALASGDVQRAMEDAQRLRRWAPPGFDTNLWYSRALAAAAAKVASPETKSVLWQQAFDAARRAPQTSEQRPNAYYNLAAFYALQNDFARTEQSLRAAIAWAPRWYKPHWMLAQLLRQAGRLAEAEAEARCAFDLDGGQDPEVTRTFQEMQPAKQR